MGLGAPNPMLLNVVESTLSWMPTIIRAAIRRTGSEVVAAKVGARARCGAWQSSADYVVRGGSGDPRGRKSGGSSGADSPTWPARTQGGKRFRSLIRNP